MKRVVRALSAFSIPRLAPMLLGVGCSVPASPDADSEPVRDGGVVDGGDLAVGDSHEQALDGDCVYVDWCDAPGANGTVCRLRASCAYEAATLNECIAETRSVCGAPTQPWLLY